MSEESGNGHENKVAVQVFTLDENHLMEAVVHYMLKKHGNGRVVNVEWLIEPQAGHKLPPIKASPCAVRWNKKGQ